MPIYSPEIFCQNDLAAAREIVLTDEAGVSSSSRWERETPWLLSLIEPHLNPSDVIVDFGCGVGRFSQPLCAKGYATIGVDASPQMREHAMSQTASAHFEAISPDELDVRIEKGFLADIVLAIWVLQHVPDLKLELSRIQRVLKPGGKLFLVNLHHRAVPTVNQSWFDDGQSVQHRVREMFSFVQCWNYQYPGAPANVVRNGYVSIYKKYS